MQSQQVGQRGRCNLATWGRKVRRDNLPFFYCYCLDRGVGERGGGEEENKRKRKEKSK